MMDKGRGLVVLGMRSLATVEKVLVTCTAGTWHMHVNRTRGERFFGLGLDRSFSVDF